MKISILISSYNKGKYIKESIESCLMQDEKNFEVILFDNFSNDETNNILVYTVGVYSIKSLQY